MVVITKLIILGIAVVCSVTLAFIVMDFVTDKVNGESHKKINRVHFYVARGMTGELWLYMCKPHRSVDEFETASNDCCFILTNTQLWRFGLNENDYKDLKCGDEPVEVFLNMED